MDSFIILTPDPDYRRFRTTTKLERRGPKTSTHSRLVSENVQLFTEHSITSHEWQVVMARRVRHCVECPKCFTRYLIGFSPYRNGSYLLPTAPGSYTEWTLYCACASPASSSRWSCRDLEPYKVSGTAHHRGYGPPEEIVRIENERDV
jgi:hypothetical protein